LLQSVAEVKTIAWKRLTSTVGRNIVSLYVLHFGNYVLPLITVPYLVRVLGPEKFGLVAFGQGLMAYFVLVVNYGFDWSATRKVAIQRDTPDLVNRTAARVWGAKALLCAASALILLALVLSVPKLNKVSLLLLILYGSVVGNMLFPTWLYQGQERMSVISLTNLGLRALGALTIFLFIRRPSDFLLYAVVLSAQGLAAGLIGAAAAFRIFRLRLTIPSWRDVQQEMGESSPLFLTTAAIALYTSGNAFILGLLTNPVAVGYYSAAEKIVTAVVGLFGPLSQAVYPRFSKLARESKTQALLWARRMLSVTGSGSLLLSVLLFAGAPLVVRVVLGLKYTPSVAVLAIMSPLPVLIAVSNVLGVQLMFPFGHEKKVLVIALAAALVNITLAALLAPRWQASGMAAAVLISEALVTLGYFVCTSISKINPWRFHEHLPAND
jgi:polysaccharide transporter, PST family